MLPLNSVSTTYHTPLSPKSTELNWLTLSWFERILLLSLLFVTSVAESKGGKKPDSRSWSGACQGGNLSVTVQTLQGEDFCSQLLQPVEGQVRF